MSNRVSLFTFLLIGDFLRFNKSQENLLDIMPAILYFLELNLPEQF
jgi:hypothetical protein